jgi:hypothetical protein
MATPQSDKDLEIILKAAELLKAGSHSSDPRVQDIIRSITSGNQGPTERQNLDNISTGRTGHQTGQHLLSHHSTANSRQLRGPTTSSPSFEQSRPRHEHDDSHVVVESSPGWTIDEFDTWRNNAVYQRSPVSQQTYHAVGVDSYAHNAQEPQVSRSSTAHTAFDSSNLGECYSDYVGVGYLDGSISSNQTTFHAGEPYPSLTGNFPIERFEREGFPDLFQHEMDQALIHREMPSVFDTESWEDIGSSSNQPPSRDSSLGSFEWEQVPISRRQSSSDRSHSSTDQVLEQLVDLEVPMTSPSRPHGRFESEIKRQETCSTRKKGACLRCRMQRLRVSSEDS